MHRRWGWVALGVGAAVFLLGSPTLAKKTYTVRQGDSAWKIAKRLGVSTPALLKANGLSDHSVLQPGQSLVLPERSVARGRQALPQRGAACPARDSRPADRYVVRKGDTLSAIAHRSGVTVKALARENHIPDPDRLREGQTLRVPATPAKPARLPVQGPGAPSARAKSRASLGTPPQSDEADQSPTSGNALVETALQYRGVPYRWAGMTSRGMDCSGLVARVLLSHGIKAPHSSRELYKLGTAVSRDQLQPGDLVFFNTRGRGISHVGIYMGESKFVHASSSGGKVETDRLDTGYYHKHYVGARRVV